LRPPRDAVRVQKPLLFECALSPQAKANTPHHEEVILEGNVKRRLKGITKECLLNSGAIKTLGSLRPTGVAILRYHSVLENPRDLDDLIGCGITHSAAVFEQQMRLLSESFVPVTMDDVLDFANGRRKTPRRAVAVTFDDGFADNATVAAPIMARYGICGAFYVTTGTIAPQPPPWFIVLRRAFRLTHKKEMTSLLDGTVLQLQVPQQHREAFRQACSYCAVLKLDAQNEWLAKLENRLEVEPFQDENGLMMTKDQIRELHTAGHIVGSHTVSHPNVAHIPEGRMKEELELSKIELERVLKTTVDHFSYPSPFLQPHYDERTIRLSREVGYRTATTCTHGLVYQGNEPLACQRVAVPDGFADFRWSIESALAGFPS